MGKHRLRLLVCAGVCLALIVASTLLLDWFHASIGIDAIGIYRLKIDLHSLHMCTPDGVCSNIPFGKLKGFYTSCAESALWGSLLFAAFVAFQAGSRIYGGAASQRLTKIGYAVGMTFVSSALAAGYLFQPESTDLAEGLIQVQRTWAPLLLLVAYVFGFLALSLSISAETVDDDFGAYKPITIPPKPGSGSRVKLRPKLTAEAKAQPALITQELPETAAKAIATPTAHADSAAPPTDLVPPLAQTPANVEDALAARPKLSRTSTAVGKVAAAITREQLRNKLLYATAIANVTESGIDAKREDGLAKLIRWRDVVGVVARRLPQQPPYDGLTFVDLVSTAGATLRILPWTRLTGEALDEDHSGEARARSFVQMIVVHCPSVQLDPATRTFLGMSRAHAAQLPDEETLAAHDARLA